MSFKVLIIVPECRKKPSPFPPYGAIYIGGWLKKHGYEVSILNQDLYRYDIEEILNQIEEYSPEIIGFSAVTSTTYGYVKTFAKAIKERFPNKFLVLGGQLSNASKVVLENTKIDIVVIGEGENTIIKLLAVLQNDEDLETVDGIAYKKDEEIVYTRPASLIRDLDVLPYPDFGLIEMDHYLGDPKKHWGVFLKDINKIDKRFSDPKKVNENFLYVLTGRGCHGSCTFCCRNIKGIRKNSVDYVVDYIEYLKNKYNVGYFSFADESFIINKKWIMEFLVKLDDRKLGILFAVTGVRVDTIDNAILSALKKSGCFMISYGFESGSQRILDVMEKRVTVAENYNAYYMTIDEGIYTVPHNVLNMPGETNETINETITFLSSLKRGVAEPGSPQYKVTYAQAHPGTALYDYAILKGLIKDEDEYLTKLTNVDAGDYTEGFKKGVLLNFSGRPLNEVLAWQEKMNLMLAMDASRRIKGEGFYIFLTKYVLKRVSNQIVILKEKGLFEWLKYAFFRFKRFKRAILETAPLTKVSKYKNKFEYLNQNRVITAELINKIKKSKFSSRETVDHETLKDIEVYLDTYGDYSLIRYPSLTKVCKKLTANLCKK